MGMLARLNPAAEAARQLQGFKPSEKLLGAMRDNPAMSKVVKEAVGIAFPPARGAMVMLEIAERVRPLLEKGLDLASQALRSSDKGAPLFQRLEVAGQFVQREASRQRVSSAF